MSPWRPSHYGHAAFCHLSLLDENLKVLSSTRTHRVDREGEGEGEGAHGITTLWDRVIKPDRKSKKKKDSFLFYLLICISVHFRPKL